MSKQPEQINAICQHNEMLAKLAQHAQLIEKLNHTLHQTLPLQFSAHCHLANIKNQTLIIHTDNAAFASLIRFQVPALCKTFTEHLEMPINHIEIKVRPKRTAQVTVKPPTTTALPESAARVIQQTAEVIGNETLSASLKKLANRFKV
jgi:hypothetical protein